MGRSLVSILATALILLAGPLSASAERVDITGQVLDEAGKPVAEVVLSTYWLSENGRWVTRKGTRTDAEGNFALREWLPPPTKRPGALLVLDATQERGVLVKLNTELAKEPLALTLQPTTLVKATWSCTGLGHDIETALVSFKASWAKRYFANHRGEPSLSLRLPPGDYTFTLGGVDCQRVAKRVKVTKDMRTVDLGSMNLEPTIIAQHYGKAPPAWHVTDARGLDADTTLDDLKGKWVLLEFWGFW